MDSFAPLAVPSAEAALLAVEQALGITITVRDLTGWLRTAEGGLLIDPRRTSHRRQEVCARGFAPVACVQHCRHATSAALLRAGATCTTECWKGVREVVVPLFRARTLQGYLFAGAWRGAWTPTGVWEAAWQRLPAWDAARAAEVAAALRLLADGLWTAGEQARRAGEPTDRAGSIRAYLRTHPTHGRAGLARHLGLSPSRTSHVVQELCGCSLQHLVISERVAAAQRLLAESDDPVEQVGAAVGWPDAPHFSRIFRRVTGSSPGAWRLHHRQA